MAKDRSSDDATPVRKKKPAGASETWSLAARIGISVAVVWHMFVVFISPLSVEPSSPLVRTLSQTAWTRWYSDPLYLNHGYHFFGPNPPMGGQIVRYQVYGDDGRVKAEGEFPSLKEQWPRLWYHRHMMLADQMSGVGIYPNPADDQRIMLRAYARHLLRKHDGTEARLEKFEHDSLHPADIREGVDPTEPRFYRSVSNVRELASNLDTPLLPPNDNRAGQGGPEQIPIGGGR